MHECIAIPPCLCSLEHYLEITCRLDEPVDNYTDPFSAAPITTYQFLAIVSVRMKENSATVHDMEVRTKREGHGVNPRLRFGVKEGSSGRDNMLSKQGCSNRKKMGMLSSRITLMVLLLRAYPKHESQRVYFGIYPNTSSSLSGLQN
jgi:hypothetical protein